MTGRFKPRLATWPIEPVLRRLHNLAPLCVEDEAVVRQACERRERHGPGEELLVEGQPIRRARFVIAGWAACQRILPDGRRQIFRFLVPGDTIGVQDAPQALWSVVALTPLETADAEAALAAVQEGHAPGLAAALAKGKVRDQQFLLDHMVRLGQQTAFERVAHLLLELQGRLEVVGLGDGQRFPLPLTQEVLADALGLSIVHVNRTLQQLRRERLIELRAGVAILLQPEALTGIADYEPPRLVSGAR